MQNVATFSVSQPPARLGRSSLAVLAGFVTVVVTHTAADGVMYGSGLFPKDLHLTTGMFVLALSYRSVLTVLGGFVTARVAPHKPLKHGLVLGALGSLGSLVGVIATLMKPDLGPLWYPVLLLLLTVPCVWLGVRIFEARSSRTAR